jgi:hypothetical protein
MSSTINRNALDGVGSVSKPVFKAQVIEPAANDIEALQGGAAITLDGLTARTAAQVVGTDKLLLRTANGTFFVTVSDLGVSLGSARPILTKEDLGLVGDGVTDDAPALQRAAELWASQGGAAFMLRAQSGKQFYFKGTPRLASNISCLFVSGHLVTKRSRLTLQGELAGAANAFEFRLLADTAAGDTFVTIDTSPHGGGPVSDFFTAGDFIRLRGLRDSCGTALEEQELRVTTVTDGTSRLDLSGALNAAYKVTYPTGDYEAAQGTANLGIITKCVSALATSDVAAGDNLWPIASGDIGKFQAGDYVMVHAENRCSDIGGSSTFLTHVEMAQIISSVPGDPAASLRLSRRVERDFTTAKFARLVKVNPIRNSLIQSATVEFTEAPDATLGFHPYEIRYGVDSVLADCTVPNQDVFGTRGAGAAIYRSLACGIERPVVRAQKYVDSGEGNGAVITSSTDCRVSGGTLAGTRHAMQAFGATNCVFQDVIVQNPRHCPLDCHGGHEVGVRFVNITASAATDYEADPGNAPAAITFGNSTHQAGAHRCGVEGGRFVGFKAADGNHEACIVPFPPSTNCYVRNAEFHRIGILLRHRDISGSGTLVTSGLRLDSVSVDDWADWLIDIDGRANGASVDTAVDFAIYDLMARNGSKMITAAYATELQVYESEFDEITPDPSNPYFLDADQCTDLIVEANSIKEARRGISLSNCTDFRVIGNRFVDLTGGTVWQDGGSNTGSWLDNTAAGTTPTATRTGASVITESPRAAGVTVMPHETAFAFRPIRKHGFCKVWNHGETDTGEVFAAFRYRVEYDLSITPVGDVTTLNVDVTTGALTGTTGNYDAFTISAADGQIWFENTLGNTITIDFSCE